MSEFDKLIDDIYGRIGFMEEKSMVEWPVSEALTYIAQALTQLRPPVIRVHADDATLLPTRGSEGAAGYDLKAAEDLWCEVGSWTAFNTGVSFEIPPGYVGLVRDRSSMAGKRGLVVIGGVIDSDFRGELRVMLLNVSGRQQLIERGDRIAQLLVVPVLTSDLVVVDELAGTARGDGGFGSTGR